MIQLCQLSGDYLLKYSGLEIPFRVSQSERTKLTINVHPDLRVEVLAPANQSLDAILARVNRRSQWIVKQWRFFEQYQPPQPERRYVGGETHVYLGRQYRIKLSRSSVSSVKLVGRYFHIHHKTPENKAEIAQLLKDWYVRHASALYQSRVKTLITEHRALHSLGPVKLAIRSMERRWGSCSLKGTITLNVDLIKAPLNCIDYVITHELCHLKIHNHSPAFYRLLSRCLPDWKDRKRRLEKLH